MSSRSSRSSNKPNVNNVKMDLRDKASQIAFAITASLIGIVINSTIIYVLNDVKSEHCPCTNDWRHSFCYYYSFLLIGLNAFIFIMGSRESLERFMPFIGMMNLINVICLVTYLHKLSTSICNCKA